MKIEKGDRVTLWNGEEGIVKLFNQSTYSIEIESIDGHITTYHIMNIRYLNRENFDC
jgi:hypothetical protein